VAEFESLTKHPYLDSVGKITIGYGFNVDRWQDFQALPLRTPDASGQLATELEKLTAFLTLRWVAALISPPPSPEGEPPSPSNRSFGKITANNYKGLTKVQLPEADSRQILDLKISDFETALIGKFGDLACFPSPAKIALMDMIYNLGATRFSADRWPNLFDSVSRRNWSEAADRCRRRGVNVERNNRARGLFLDAADAEVNAISPSIGGSSLGKVGQ
jgi:GH24 family phage-related lysozyme (muramidase)